MEKSGQETQGQKWSRGSAVLSGATDTHKKTDLKGTEHPMADAFGESSNSSGENDDILGHHQIILGEWQGWCPANFPVGGDFEILLRKKEI